MAVLNFRKFSISKKVSTFGYDDENGDYHEGVSEWSEPEVCDLVQNAGRATITKYQDGTTITYAYTVYIPKGSAMELSEGDVVRVERDGEVVVETDVKGFSKNQLQSKVWL